MSTVKRISGDYTIKTVNTTDKIIINSGNVYIEGNLWVSGNAQTYTANNTSITDHIITLNAGVASPNPYGANIIVDRGSSPDVGIAWNEGVQAWQISNDGSVYANIASSASGFSLFSDPAPKLGANLNLNGKTIWDGTTNATVVTLSTPGGAGSGVYVTPTSTGTTSELVTQSKALAYSIIFG